MKQVNECYKKHTYLYVLFSSIIKSMNMGFSSPKLVVWYGWWKHLHFFYCFHKRCAVTEKDVTSVKLGALRMRGKNLACTCVNKNLREVRMHRIKFRGSAHAWDKI